MPKETKKFINPLLRPSPNADGKSAQSSQSAVVEDTEEKLISEPSAKRLEAQPESAQIEDAQLPAATTRQMRANEKNAENAPSAVESSSGSARRNSATRSQSPREETQARSNQSAPNEDTIPDVRSRSLAEPINLSSEDYALEEAFANYDPTTFTEDSRAAARRRRNPQQPFETTHERITLWMDKQLKQRFEALASQRELPKTALINEAVTALLKKYEAR
ncbi:hypothetical protein KDH_15270 [Dictyobacter sp. S3.2.2.5]|uniref:Ribbon-helix-helix protein CopG domain-containing protein n=1 Tax=Dictyobacter halimunensis TaxID=3026934 RepID=A0ABQ6FM59_9CHLR|nr:hypothetical protein KDH_15270 [Dictyobacter sp. S3.2.2.5]